MLDTISLALFDLNTIACPDRAGDRCTDSDWTVGTQVEITFPADAPITAQGMAE